MLPNKKPKDDFQSKTSNALAKVLNLKGEVIIGDKALKFLLKIKIIKMRR